MNVTLGVSTWLWTSPFNSQALDLFPKIKEIGYNVVEIPVEDPELIDTRLVKQRLQQYDLKAVVCGAFGPTRDLTHQDKAVHENCFHYL